MFKVFLLIVIFPLAELWILIEIGKVIGSGPTVLLVIGTGLLGALLVRLQGFRILAEIRRELLQGHLPGEKLLDGICLLAGGLLLLTPGLISDLGGFLLLIPATRSLIQGLLRRYLRQAVESGHLLTRWRW